MSVAGPSQDANSSPTGGSAAATAASVGSIDPPSGRPKPMRTEHLPRAAQLPLGADAQCANCTRRGTSSVTWLEEHFESGPLLLAALAEGSTQLTGLLDEADDTRRMLDALRVLGVHDRPRLSATGGHCGVNGAPGAPGSRFVAPPCTLGNAGTGRSAAADGGTCRCRAAIIVIDGAARMRERPDR